MPDTGLEPGPALLSLAIGLGLAAACGFRVFVPLLMASVAARVGHLPLAAGFGWLASLPALIALATATVLEVGAYYIPWLDHALDTIATPTAVLAGILASASVVTQLPPILKWSAAIIGGGGAAGLIQGASVLFRLKSSVLTGGLGNPVVSTAELVGAIGTALLALVWPLVCLVIVVALVIIAFRATGHLLFGRHPAAAG
ncbi:MAG TPA: DUF4126 domain-containing protein [Gemmatimonadales bacterium]|nr:DUF4126 domain-containing protein [Gemmatimonadales bacterium]